MDLLQPSHSTKKFVKIDFAIVIDIQIFEEYFKICFCCFHTFKTKMNWQVLFCCCCFVFGKRELTLNQPSIWKVLLLWWYRPLNNLIEMFDNGQKIVHFNQVPSVSQSLKSSRISLICSSFREFKNWLQNNKTLKILFVVRKMWKLNWPKRIASYIRNRRRSFERCNWVPRFLWMFTFCLKWRTSILCGFVTL